MAEPATAATITLTFALVIIGASNVVTALASFITTRWVDTRKLGEEYMKKEEFAEHCAQCTERLNCKHEKLAEDNGEIKEILTVHTQELKVANLVQLELCEKVGVPKDKIDDLRDIILNNK
jgi:hypothetical protein